MSTRKASMTLTCAAASLLLQSCVQYVPDASYAPPPQSPAYTAQYAGAPPSPPAPHEDAPAGVSGAVDGLVAPIALYPDPLIALILPASTVPADISAAAAYLVQYGDVSRVDSQPWDPSVRGLAHYPTVVTWMAENMPWTQALGSAFLSSPSDVMDAIQRLRARALAAGTLASTPQQQVYSDGDAIDIYPAQPDFLYVPVYDDSVVYSDGPYYGYGGPYINFGEPYPEGPWMSFYFDWGGHRVWAGDRNVWREHGGWQPPRIGGGRTPPGAHPWRPPGAAPGVSLPGGSVRVNPAPRPRPMPGAPSPPPAQYRRPAAQQGLAAATPSYVPAPRTSAPPLDRPRLNSPLPAPGEYARPVEPEARNVPPQGQPRYVQGNPGREPGPSAPPPPAGRQYSQAPAPAPHEAASHASAPASAPAPAPPTESGKQDPQK